MAEPAPGADRDLEPDEVVRGFETQLQRHLQDVEDPKRPPYDKLVNARRCAEAICRAVLRREGGDDDLQKLVQDMVHRKLVPDVVRESLTWLRASTNHGAHVRFPNPPDYEEQWTKGKPCLEDVVRWFYGEHLRESMPPAVKRALRTIRPRKLASVGQKLALVGLGAALMYVIPLMATSMPDRGPRPTVSQATGAPSTSVPAPPVEDASVPTGPPPLRRPPRFIEIPDRTVPPFLMQDTEATVEQYLACVSAGSCTGSATDTSAVRPAALPEYCTAGAGAGSTLPINCIDALEAERLCIYLGQEHLDRPGRLPTRDEWLRAADWNAARTVFWDDPDTARRPNLCDQAFIAEQPTDRRCRSGNMGAEHNDGHAGPAEVGTTERQNRHRLFDILGNVAEVTRAQGGYVRMGRGFRSSVTPRRGPSLDRPSETLRVAQGGVRCAVDAR